ncbi:MAG: hypothetical protein CL431_01290 [Acidimicrobiaceae bacterium]|nr:hypothetical protein [Acidimicrobiaceae bacterium]
MDDLIENSESELNKESFTFPPVRIVVLTHNENDWFRESVASFANQNYSDKQLTVLSTGGTDWIEAIISQHFPEADVSQVNAEDGLGANFNKVLESADEPAFYFFCHHDVALAPDTIRLMVEESYRSNAAVVGPKIVNWDRPNELLDVGVGINSFAVPIRRVSAGEIDQEQFDSVEEVFAVSNTAFLVRADLFQALDGFDEAMGMFGEDLDFCWRSQIAGGKVLVVPGAVVRHRDENGDYQANPNKNNLLERHRIRSILGNYGAKLLLPVFIVNFLVSLLRGLLGLLRGRLSDFLVFSDAWCWNLLNLKSLLSKRRNIKQLRRVNDSELATQKVKVSSIQAFFATSSSIYNNNPELNSRFRIYIDDIRNGPSKVSLAFLFLVTSFFAFGSRHLITRKVPVVGELVPFDRGSTEILENWASGYWLTGLGYEGAMPNAMGLIGVLGIFFWGFMGLLRTVLTLGMIPLGVAGIWLFLKPFGSPYVKVTGAVIYFVSPIQFYALSVGNWDALILYGALPWALIMIGRAGESSPFGKVGGQMSPNALSRDFFREVVSLGLLLGLIVSLSTISVIAMIMISLLVICGSLIAGTAIKLIRLISVIVVSCLIGLVLNLPWFLDTFVYDPSLESIFGNRTPNSDSIGVLKAITLTPNLAGNSILGWGFPAIAAVPLLIAKGERWAWAVRGWTFYLAGVALVWVQKMEFVSIVFPPAETLLIPAALGLAIAAAMGAGALQRDLQTFKFGWRQMVPVTAFVAVAMTILPFLGSTFSGDWGMPNDELNTAIAYQEGDSNRKVLWISNSDLLPNTGREFTEDLSIMVTNSLKSSFESRWLPPKTNVDDLLIDSLDLARSNGTSNLGVLLAQFGISDIVLVERLAPLPSRGPNFEIEERLKLALSRQLDLAKIEISPGITRYQNLSSIGYAVVATDSSTVGRDIVSYASDTGTPFLDALDPVDDTMRKFQGRLNLDEEIYIAFPYSQRWSLEINGASIDPDIALNWATGFSLQTEGTVDIAYKASSSQKTAVTLQVILWAIIVVAFVRAVSDAKVSRI